MALSKRLEKIVQCMDYADVVADIGTDHAYLPIALVEWKKTGYVIAMDLREKPLLRAQKNIEKAGLAGKIETRISDGARRLARGEADVVTMSGMGGALMTRIIYERPEVFTDLNYMLLSPQSEVRDFRRSLMDMKYQIVDEWMVEDGKKYYFIIKAEAGVEQNPYSECELCYGRELLRKKDETLLLYIGHEMEIQKRLIARLAPANNENKLKRLNEISARLQIMNEAMEYYAI